MVADAVCRDVEEAIVCDCDYMFEKYISYVLILVMIVSGDRIRLLLRAQAWLSRTKFKLNNSTSQPACHQVSIKMPDMIPAKADSRPESPISEATFLDSLHGFHARCLRVCIF
jgi:hypothetical protein